MLIARACMRFGRRQLDGDRKRLWRGRETSRRFSRICRADLNESGTEHQSRTLMSRIDKFRATVPTDSFDQADVQRDRNPNRNTNLDALN